MTPKKGGARAPSAFFRRVKELVALARYAGERFDLVQGGGGNASVKLSDGRMLIKASGWALSEVEPGAGLARVDARKLAAAMARAARSPGGGRRAREALAARLLRACSKSDVRPSMETFLHVFLPRYVLHTHPLAVNALSCRKDWRERLGSLFPDAALVGYKTPGIELGLELRRVVGDRSAGAPLAIFLQNHGLIVGSPRAADAARLTEEIVSVIARGLDGSLADYRLANDVSRYLRPRARGPVAAHLCEDARLDYFLRARKELIFTGPVCPDDQVYCGREPFDLRSLRDRAALSRYLARCGALPRVVAYRGRLFFVARSIRKAREAEEMFKAHVMTLSLSRGSVRFLPREELAFLDAMESEVFRRER